MEWCGSGDYWFGGLVVVVGLGVVRGDVCYFDVVCCLVVVEMVVVVGV